MSPDKSERLAWRVAHVLRIAHLLVDQWPEGAQRLTAGVIRPLTNVLGRLDPARWTSMYQQLLDLKLIQKPFDPAVAYTLQFMPKGS